MGDSEHPVPEQAVADLYALSQILGERDPAQQVHGVLGGQWGYGQEFENDVFTMFPFYWGDCTCGYDEAEAAWDEANEHEVGCYQVELEASRRQLGLSWTSSDEYHEATAPGGPERHRTLEERLYRDLTLRYGLPLQGCAVHCTCSRELSWEQFLDDHAHTQDCPLVRPNFEHRPSGLRVTWYKYIGRGMAASRPVGSAEWSRIFKECRDSLA